MAAVESSANVEAQEALVPKESGQVDIKGKKDLSKWQIMYNKPVRLQKSS